MRIIRLPLTSTSSRANANLPRTTSSLAYSVWTALLPLQEAYLRSRLRLISTQNGIVNVSAKDLGTGKEQKISITASTNMSKEDIQKAVDEAAKYADEDKKRKDAVDAKNAGENMVFQCEKALTDFGDKVSEEERANIQSKIDALKAANATENTEDIKAKTEELQKAFYEVSQKIYQAAGAQAQQDGAAGADMGGGADSSSDDNGGDYVDADFTEK